ncbi:CAP domain-containing protein [Psychrobacter sp. TWP2-1-2]|uniref:CAP domain-containing protein n=1 Tax=Psychrobacter sp. TWP2-1-2 TaxID=2804623 RepID=UPI003CEC832C
MTLSTLLISTPQKNLAAVLFLTVFITACGGGGGGSDSSSNTNAPSPNPPAIEPNDQPNGNTSDNSSDNVGDQPDSTTATNEVKAALIANNKFSLARTSCGLSGLSVDTALDDVAIKHANYIKYVFANSSPTAFSAHYENKIADISGVTSSNNPFFGGLSFTDRLSNANYPNVRYGVTENIAQSIHYSSAGNLIRSDVVAGSMAKSLLAAPYHLRSLMMPSASVTGTGVVIYEPYNKEAANNQGYVLVNHAAATQATKDNTIKGVFTYPCEGVTDTVTALYNETPDPVKHTGRDLRVDPIGQPIYINMPSAQTIDISNVTFHDIQRNIDVPIELLDYRQDPYKNTANALPENEAFILPITDNLKSCQIASKKGKNCGLHGNSDYRVSFDILVDNKTIERESFTFTTGIVN